MNWRWGPGEKSRDGNFKKVVTCDKQRLGRKRNRKRRDQRNAGASPQGHNVGHGAEREGRETG